MKRSIEGAQESQYHYIYRDPNDVAIRLNGPGTLNHMPVYYGSNDSIQYLHYGTSHRLDGYAALNNETDGEWALFHYGRSYGRRRHACESFEYIQNFNVFDRFERYGVFL